MTTKKRVSKKKITTNARAKKKTSPKKKASTKKNAVDLSKNPDKTVQAGSPDRISSVPRKKKVTAKKKRSVKKKAPVRKKATKRAVKKAPAKKRANSSPPVKKLRARQRRLGPIPKYHIDHKSWDRAAVMEVICQKLMSGSKGIAYICRDDDELPSIAIVHEWLAKENSAGGEKPLLDMYTRAKQIQIDYLVDETVEISDNEAGNPVVIDGVVVLVDKKPVMQVDTASVQHAKLRSDNRKWIAERLAHRKYGNKLEVSSDPERPLSTVSDDELDNRIKALQRKISDVAI